METVAGGQDLSERGDRLLGAVFLVAGDENHMFPTAGSVPAGIDQRTLLRERGESDQKGEGAGEHSGHGVHDNYLAGGEGGIRTPGRIQVIGTLSTRKKRTSESVVFCTRSSL